MGHPDLRVRAARTVYTADQFPVFDNFQYSNAPPTLGSPESYTPPDHEIVWGIGAGSRIRRDKLFWFAALDSYHRNDPGLAMVKHPYLANADRMRNHLGCTPTTTGFFATPSDAQLQLLSAQLGLSSANPEVGRADGVFANAGTNAGRTACSAPRRAPPRNGSALAASTGRRPSGIASRSKASARTGTRPAAD